MILIGKVALANKKRTVCGIRTEYGYTVFVSKKPIVLGSVVQGKLLNHGSEMLKNVSTNENVQVFIEKADCTREIAIKLMKEISVQSMS